MTDTDEKPTEHNERAEAQSSRRPLRTGVYTAALLVIVMFSGLVVANRFPSLERYAFERNAAFYTVFVLLMLVPVIWFLDRPVQMFAAAMVGWVLFVGAYDLAGTYFRNLFQVLRTPFEALVEGAIVYGLCAVGSWVAGMILHARRHPIVPVRKAPIEAARHTR
ncbi:MAG TPA: hypothetical protein VN822_10565 [Candidatus Acidoferrales bacterium]|nr:hypothetical protein [Candidatus Acidoferrales bacterium]